MPILTNVWLWNNYLLPYDLECFEVLLSYVWTYYWISQKLWISLKCLSSFIILFLGRDLKFDIISSLTFFLPFSSLILNMFVSSQLSPVPQRTHFGRRLFYLFKITTAPHSDKVCLQPFYWAFSREFQTLFLLRIMGSVIEISH